MKRLNQRALIRSIVGGTLLAAAPLVAAAQTITFTHAGSGASGMIGNTVFNNVDFTIVGTGNVADRQMVGISYFINHLSAQISIAGIGTYNFITGTRTFVRSTGIVGFARAGSANLYDSEPAPELVTWDMTTSVGILTGNMQLFQWTLVPVVTSGGPLRFDSQVINGSFQAIVGPGTIVPEPSTYALMAAGLLTIGFVSSRRGLLRS